MLQAFKKRPAFLLAFLLIVGVIYGFNRVTDGFSVREIQSSLAYRAANELSVIPSIQNEELCHIFHQPFHYIGKGAQFYIFESEDGCFVVKFFKHKHLRPLDWLNNIPFPSSLRHYCAQKIEKREARISHLFASCKLAYEELPQETGVVYLHLNRGSDLKQELTLIDKVGLKHKISIGDYEFVLQKKAIGAGALLSELTRLEQGEDIRVTMDQIAQVVLKLCEKGVRDCDPAVVQNVAFSTDRKHAMFIDIGQFVKDENIKRPEERQKELFRRLKALRAWAEEHKPELVHFVDEKINLLPWD